MVKWAATRICVAKSHFLHPRGGQMRAFQDWDCYFLTLLHKICMVFKCVFLGTLLAGMLCVAQYLSFPESENSVIELLSGENNVCRHMESTQSARKQSPQRVKRQGIEPTRWSHPDKSSPAP